MEAVSVVPPSPSFASGQARKLRFPLPRRGRGYEGLGAQRASRSWRGGLSA